MARELPSSKWNGRKMDSFFFCHCSCISSTFFVALGSFKRSIVYTTGSKKVSQNLSKNETFLGLVSTTVQKNLVYLAAKLAAFRLFASFAKLLGFDTSESASVPICLAKDKGSAKAPLLPLMYGL